VALLDLSAVTKALTELLRAHIRASAAWPFATYGQPNVSGAPPDQMSAGSLGVHLYHLAEDPQVSFDPPASTDPVPVRLTPMALRLHYVVCALGSGLGEQISVQEQILLGCAAKALHDYPVIDDSTTVPRAAPATPLRVLQAAGIDGAGNRFRVTLQPTTATEAQAFWSAAGMVPRPALFYEVGVVLLAPEQPRSLAGRVLAYGVNTFVAGAPRLDGSQNEITVTMPGQPTQDILVRPAEVPVDGRFSVTGSDLAADETQLVLAHPSWADPVVADPAWDVAAGAARVSATVRETVAGRPVVPGQYTARVVAVRRLPQPGGAFRELPVTSNGTPFTISARVDSVARAGDVVTITGYTFAAPGPGAFPSGAVQLCLGPELLAERSAPGTLEPGEFRVDDPATISLRLPAGLPVGQPVSLRLFVLGAESPPMWLVP
jgi:hypothetical protein